METSKTEDHGADVIDMPMTPEILNAKLSKLISLTYMLSRDGETIWDKTVLLQRATADLIASDEAIKTALTEAIKNQKLLLESHTTLTNHVLALKSPVTKREAVAYIMIGAGLGGGLSAAVFHLLLRVFHIG